MSTVQEKADGESEVHTRILRKVIVKSFGRSIPAQIYQLALYISKDEEYVDRFVWELTFAKQLYKNFL